MELKDVLFIVSLLREEATHIVGHSMGHDLDLLHIGPFANVLDQEKVVNGNFTSGKEIKAKLDNINKERKERDEVKNEQQIHRKCTFLGVQKIKKKGCEPEPSKTPTAFFSRNQPDSCQGET